MQVLSGNNQRRFAIKRSIYVPPASPTPPVEETINIAGDTVILCANSSNVTQPIADVLSTVETFTIPSGDRTAVLTLDRSLDYEDTQEYELLLQIKASGLQGNITIRVKKSPVIFAQSAKVLTQPGTFTSKIVILNGYPLGIHVLIYRCWC